MTSLQLAWISLSRHRLTTLTVIIAMSLSVACGGLLLRLYRLSESRFVTMGIGGDAIVGAKAGSFDILLGALNGEERSGHYLPFKLFQSLREEQTVHFEDGRSSTPSSIQSIIPVLYYAHFKKYQVMGTDSSFIQRPRRESLTLREGAWFSQPGEIVLGAAVADSQKVRVGETITLHVDSDSSETESLKVVGILSPTHSYWDQVLYTSIDQAQQTLAQFFKKTGQSTIWGSQVLQYFLVYLNASGFSSFESLINQRTVGQVIRVEDTKEELQQLSSAGRDIGFLVTLFIMMMGALTVSSMLIARFEGMSLQLAVLRALGYRKRELASWLLWEGILLSGIGVFFGALLDEGLLPLFREWLGSALPPADLVASSLAWSAPVWFVAIGATLLAVFIPILQMARQNIHAALRGL